MQLVVCFVVVVVVVFVVVRIFPTALALDVL
jgi:hypothetical protein